MERRKVKKAKFYTLVKNISICDLEIPLDEDSQGKSFEYIKYEYAEVISWNQKGPRYALIETASFPDERRTTFSIWDDWRDIIDHLFGVLQDRVQMYQVCKIYTYPNFFRDLLSHRKYVKYHLHKIEEIDGGVYFKR